MKINFSLFGFHICLWVTRKERPANPEALYIELNNLYLDIERGTKRLNIHSANRLRELVSKVYPVPGEETLREYWEAELLKLPGWEMV